MKKIILLLILSTGLSAQAGTISDYCKKLANNEIELEDGADYYATLNDNVLKPLKAGTSSMQVYAEALELNVVEVGYQLDSQKHCSIIETLEDQNNIFELTVTKTTCTGYTVGQNWGETYEESKKASLSFCTVGAITEGQKTLITRCEEGFGPLALIKVEFLETANNESTADFNLEGLTPYFFNGGEDGVSFSMSNEAGQGFSLNSDGEGSGSVFKELKLYNVSANGTNQRFNNYTCTNEDI